jgi:tetratricopeptide (TPR) repeat protein/tRNA A-37 threonylcarbamoyl transferase component Bud32
VTIRCPKCHSENPETLKFCGECGTQLLPRKEMPPQATATLQTPIHELTTGSTFAGRYQVIEELGHGGMGRVYKVFDTKIREKIALKLIKPEIAADTDTIERFNNELRLARQVRHRNVCGMFDLGEAEGAHFITMEYVPGEDLKSMIRMTGMLGIGTAVSVGKQVCDGLTEAHHLGIVHRDLKPTNIMIDKGGNAKIMDFGIARSVKEKGITGPSILIGTPEYMSPEQAEGKEVDQRSDIYSLGVILYEMATGRVPFEGETALSIAMKHKGEIPKSPKQLNPNIPNDLSGVILRCLEKDKARRYQTAADVRAELDKVEKGIPTTERVVPERRTRTSREITVKFTPRKLLLPAFVIMALAAAALVIWHVLPRRGALLPAGGKPVLAVLYFKNNTGDKAFDVWRDGLSTAIITGLSQSKYISVLSANDIYGILKRLNLLDAANYAPEDLKNTAAAGRANHAMTGSLSKAGDMFRIDYALEDLARHKALGSGSVTGTGENSILTSLVDELIRKVKVDLDLSAQEIAADPDKMVGRITTSSAEAFKFYIEGTRFHKAGRFREAIALYEKALDLDPEFASAYRVMATCYWNLGFDDRRREFMEKALKYVDRLSDYEKFMIQAQYAQILEKPAAAIEAFKKGLDLYPGEDTFSINLGSQFRSLEEFSRAVEILEVPWKNHSANFLVYNGLAWAYAGLADYDRAVEVLHGYIVSIEDIAFAHLQLAYLYVQSGKLDAALAEVDRAFSMIPNDKDCIMEKGDILYYKDDFSAAEEEYRPLVEAAEPEVRLNAMFSLGMLQVARGQFRKAIEQMEQAIALAGKTGEKSWAVQARNYLSYVFYGLKDYRQSLEHNDQVLKYGTENKSDSWTRNGLITRARCLAAMRSLPEALKTAEDLKKLYEGGLNKKLIRNYYAVMSKIELERGDFPGAIRYAEDGLALAPYGDFAKPASIYDLLGQAHYRKGDLDQARAAYEKIATLTTGRLAYGGVYALSFYWLGKIAERQGDKGRARDNYRKFLDLWKDADLGLPEPEDARKHLSNLGT